MRQEQEDTVAEGGVNIPFLIDSAVGILLSVQESVCRHDGS